VDRKTIKDVSTFKYLGYESLIRIIDMRRGKLLSFFCGTTRGLAMKLLEWFNCSHTRVHTAFWEGSTSKYSPWAAMRLAQRYCLLRLETLLELPLWNSFHWSHFSCKFLTSRNFRHFKVDIIYGNSQKSYGAKSQEKGVFHFGNRFLGPETAWQGGPCDLALSWWRS